MISFNLKIINLSESDTAHNNVHNNPVWKELKNLKLKFHVLVSIITKQFPKAEQPFIL